MHQTRTATQLKQLHLQYGDAFYLFDKQVLKQNISGFKLAFEHFYQHVQLAYSVKTNYIPAVCKVARDEGLLAEVVSGMEYELVKKAGFQGSEIIFNGPLKAEDELVRAFSDGALVQFDSRAEFRVLKQYLDQHPGENVRCAIRCNFDIGEAPRSRFGFDAENGEAEAVCEELFAIEGCKLIGLHCHFSTRNRSAESFRIRTKKLIRLAKKVFNGRRLEYLNIGGGFFGPLPESLSSQYEFEIPSFSDYGEAVGNQMKHHFPQQAPLLILEPGISLLADTMKFVCKVASIKTIGATPVVTLTGSLHNVRPNLSNIEIPLSVVKMTGHKNSVENGMIGGYTCVKKDILCDSFTGEIQEGDSVLFDNVGAYNIVFKPPFMRGAPPILMTDGSNPDDGVEVIREKETLDNMFATYKF